MIEKNSGTDKGREKQIEGKGEKYLGRDRDSDRGKHRQRCKETKRNRGGRKYQL